MRDRAVPSGTVGGVSRECRGRGLHPLRQGQRPFVGADDHRLNMRARRLGVREAPQGFAHAPHPIGQRAAAVVSALDNAERGADRGGQQGAAPWRR